MGPELENDDEDESALEKMKKVAQRKIKVRAFEGRVKDLVKREKIHKNFGTEILGQTEFLTHERFELIEADEWADLNLFQREKENKALAAKSKSMSATQRFTSFAKNATLAQDDS